VRWGRRSGYVKPANDVRKGTTRRAGRRTRYKRTSGVGEVRACAVEGLQGGRTMVSAAEVEMVAECGDKQN
jgi:hypothetical protein